MKSIRLFSVFLTCLLTIMTAQMARSESSPLDPGAHFAKISDATLWYKVAGHGPVLILTTPGWAPNSVLYQRTFTRLEDHFTVVYLETRGSGHSSRGLSTPYRFGIFADDMDGIRQYLGLDKVWVLGHSMGGEIALDYGIRYRDHVAGLIIIGSPPGYDAEYNAAADAAMKTKSGEPWYASASAAMKALNPPVQSDAELGKMLDPIWPFYFDDVSKIPSFDKLGGPLPFSAWAFNLVFSNPLPAFSDSDMAKITAPTIVIGGTAEVIVPISQLARIAEAVPNAQLIGIPNAAHFPWIEQADEFYHHLALALSQVHGAP